MIELFGIIEANNLIGDYSLEDLIELLEKNNTNNYSIQLVSKNRIIIKDNVTNTLGKLDCVCNYFDILKKDCSDIKDDLNFSQSYNCKDCFKECINKLQNGSLNKKK